MGTTVVQALSTKVRTGPSHVPPAGEPQPQARAGGRRRREPGVAVERRRGREPGAACGGRALCRGARIGRHGPRPPRRGSGDAARRKPVHVVARPLEEARSGPDSCVAVSAPASVPESVPPVRSFQSRSTEHPGRNATVTAPAPERARRLTGGSLTSPPRPQARRRSRRTQAEVGAPTARDGLAPRSARRSRLCQAAGRRRRARRPRRRHAVACRAHVGPADCPTIATGRRCARGGLDPSNREPPSSRRARWRRARRRPAHRRAPAWSRTARRCPDVGFVGRRSARGVTTTRHARLPHGTPRRPSVLLPFPQVDALVHRIEPRPLEHEGVHPRIEPRARAFEPGRDDVPVDRDAYVLHRDRPPVGALLAGDEDHCRLRGRHLVDPALAVGADGPRALFARAHLQEPARRAPACAASSGAAPSRRPRSRPRPPAPERPPAPAPPLRPAPRRGRARPRAPCRDEPSRAQPSPTRPTSSLARRACAALAL